MKGLIRLTILAGILAVTASCTEEISEEIQNSEKIQSETEAQSFVNKAIRVVNKMDSNLSYIMHKSGSLSDACELKAPSVGFNSSDYQKTDPNYALDCILDVEELDLYFEGLNFEVQVDQNLCEYVAYKPFGFMKLMPGNTQKKNYQIECDTSCAALRPELCDKKFETYASGSPFVAGTTLQNLVTDEPMCHFDYSLEFSGSSKEYPNCDEGKISTQIISLSGIQDDPLTDTVDESRCDDADIVVSAGEISEVDCSGDHNSCLSGPVTEEPDLNHLEDNYYVIYDNRELESFTKDWSYDGSIKRLHDDKNIFLANYSRICSDTTTNKSLDSAFETLQFKGDEIEAHRTVAGALSQASDLNGDGVNDITALAENPFRASKYTSPYYSVLCLDKAKDVKAQIRVFVREWDREMPSSNAYLSRVSDVGTAGTVYIDTRDTLQDFTLAWNDYDDWDDFFEDESVFTQNQCSASTTPFDKSKFPDYP